MKTSIVKQYETKIEDDNPYPFDVPALRRLLSHNADIYVVQSPRNVGKSRTAMDFAQEFLDRGKNIAWLRYNNTEMAQSINTWLEYNPNLEKDKTRTNKYCKWFKDPYGGGSIMFGSWNISQNMKGIDTPFDWMICDEFIPERYTNKSRLSTEFADWTSVYKSIKRNTDMRVLLISNNIFWLNPFFIAWEIPPFSKGTIYKVKHKYQVTIDGSVESTEVTIAVQNVRMSKACIRRNLKQSAVSFTSDNDIEYYFDNATQDEYNVIGKCPKMNLPLSNYQLMSDNYYFSHRMYEGIIYWTKCKWDQNKETYVSNPSHIDKDRLHYRMTDLGKRFERYFNEGSCVFDSAETLFIFYRWLRELRTRV